ncbi:hypothetical protein [Sulfobacillus thermosulfidooxidans]|uniref:hypothetical protein n=1 Tax=Sulfobacillus thermosulfidooxidans TaxID=28034 RepID=UPI00096BB21E|nr:hypothetical protein [Sulfobacillus thermosulfidooxidans]OLZ09552.1 hypothetical protein BFX05_11320 [Sulfobacillus thermosulfidooxidans]OLZ16142.1 hypothetical protein BFX06_03720 [Sulfobacillus thermosulfidooxidans]OLZ18010.1 hypothetical protein BFX07_06410 [Sulfobacillus thermosulfidooxidans]
MYRDPNEEIVRLQGEIAALQEKLLRLRSSRRVLMHLLTAQSQEKQWQIQRLEHENRLLRTRLRQHHAQHRSG